MQRILTDVHQEHHYRTWHGNWEIDREVSGCLWIANLMENYLLSVPDILSVRTISYKDRVLLALVRVDWTIYVATNGKL